MKFVPSVTVNWKHSSIPYQKCFQFTVTNCISADYSTADLCGCVSSQSLSSTHSCVISPCLALLIVSLRISPFLAVIGPNLFVFVVN